MRGNGATFVSMAEIFPGTVKLEESPRQSLLFPEPNERTRIRRYELTKCRSNPNWVALLAG